MVRALREALDSCAPGAALPPTVAPIVRALCKEVHGARLRPEEMLVAIKPVLQQLPEVRRLPPPARAELLARVVTLCIRGYFGRAIDPS